MGKGNGGGGFFAGFLIGGIAGAAAAMFLTQDEARDRIAEKAREAGSMAMDATGDLRDRVGDAANAWQSNVSDLYERGKQAVESARSTIDAAVAEGQATAAKMRDDLTNEAQG